MNRHKHTSIRSGASLGRSIFSQKNILRGIGLLLILGIFGAITFWALYLRSMPSIESLAKGDYFRESTIIYDKDKNPIYTLFKDGKRTYISYDNISPAIIDAIVSTEDKTFFTNPGFDIKGLIRAGMKYVIGSSETIKGTSTISQQLIKNTLLTNEHSLKRKVQEAILSYELNKQYSKEKILEMYLNAISYGYNANGVEEASKTYFGKSAKEVGPLGASILASLPKGPTYYSPYLHRDRLMGITYVYDKNDPENTTYLESSENKKEFNELYSSFKTYLSGMTLNAGESTVEICGVRKEYTRKELFSPDTSGCIEIIYDELLNFYGDILIHPTKQDEEWTSLVLEYNIGRKDFVATRMLEDRKIDGAIFQKIIVDGLDFEFRRYTEAIKYPYFVMYIKEYLETKYAKDIDISKWLKIYTTLDPKLQDKAEELVKKQVQINKKQYGANSAALLSMDNKTGKLLAMVGGPDYFDEKNGGSNNMTLAKRQPGSSFKPFVYALAISKNPIGPESPIADVQTKFGGWNPDNYDREFKGIMMTKNALAYSRNIPAAKMFFLAWGEESLVQFGRSIGLQTLKENAGYGAPLAIGTAEVRPIDLLQGYSVLANAWVRRDIYAIERIEDGDGSILEEHAKSPEEKSIFSPAASYIVTKILSDASARPEDSFWRNALNISGRTVAAKTGTSNKDVSKWGVKKILPRDLWTAGYSPQITTVVWAGNVDGKETGGRCDGLNCAAPIWKGFMEFAHKDLPKEEFQKPEGVYTYTIAKVSGKLSTKDTPKEQQLTTIMAVKLDAYDEGMKEEKIDTLCNGPVSENTPPESIGTVYIPSAKPIIDGYDPAWTAWFFQAAGMIAGSGKLEKSDAPCERPGVGNVLISLQTVWVNSDLSSAGKKIIEYSWIGDHPIVRGKISQDSQVKSSFDFGSEGKLNGSQRVSLDLKNGDHTFQIELVDAYGFRYTESKTLKIGSTQNSVTTGSLPVISLTNPRSTSASVNLYTGDKFNLRFNITVWTDNREISVILDEKNILNAPSGDTFVVPVSSEGLSVGKHTISIILMDGNLQKTTKNVVLTILPR